MAKEKPNMNVVFVGHVDAGKSTIVGQLMFQSGAVSEQEMKKLKDEAEKHFGLIVVLNYGINERNLKVEISNREFPDSYEIKNYLGISMNVMVKPDLFAHKLCALIDRNTLTNRDIFDIYYFLKQKTYLNRLIIEQRMKTGLNDYLDLCIKKIEKINSKSLLNGLGELVDDNLKGFVKTKLKDDTIQMLNIFKEFPLTI